MSVRADLSYYLATMPPDMDLQTVQRLAGDAHTRATNTQ